jgi:hypothetical protein
MRRLTTLARVIAACSATLLATACRDTLGDGAISPQPNLPPTAQLVIMPVVAGDSVITVDVRLSGLTGTNDAVKPVSMTAAVQYDTTRLRYLADASPSDGAMRAVHAARGRVMIAAAHATGFTGDVFARVRFVARDASAGLSLSLQLSELHLSDATDVRDRTTVLPTAVRQ